MPTIVSESDVAERTQTPESREFYLAEYQAVQNTMQFVRNDLLRTEAVSALAVATILSWLMTGGPEDTFSRQGILGLALTLTFAAGLRAISRNMAANRIALYLMELETALGDGINPKGYENFSHQLRIDRGFKYFQPLLMSRILIWGAMLVGPIVLLTRI